MSTSTTLTESHLLEDDKTIPSAIVAGIDDLRSQFLLSPKRKVAETGDGAAEKRNRAGDETEEQKTPLGKQQGGGGGGGCQCKGGGEHEMEECECKGESEENMSMDVLPDYVHEYYKRHNAIFGTGFAVGTLGSGKVDDDSDDERIGAISFILKDPEMLKKWPERDPVMCCSYPFVDLDFKKDTKGYNDLKAFGGKAVDYLNTRYHKRRVSFMDIERVESCSASCEHRVVILKAMDTHDYAWRIVLRGLLPPGGFAEANPGKFHLLEYC